MSLTALALVNGILAGALLATLAYACRISFRLDRAERSVPADVAVLDSAPEPDYAYERAAA